MTQPTLAICFSGSLRSIENCYISFIENIYNINKGAFNIVIFYYIPKDVNSDKIYEIPEIMNLNPIIKILPDTELEKPNCIWRGRQHKIDAVSNAGLTGWLYQIQGIEYSYNMVLEYEKENNIKFDYIARLRTDVLFLQPFNFKDCDDNVLTVPFFHKWGGINDRFAFGKSNLMVIYMKMYSKLYEYCSNQKFDIGNAEQFCEYNLKNNNIKYYENSNILFNRVREHGGISKDCAIDGRYNRPNMNLI